MGQTELKQEISLNSRLIPVFILIITIFILGYVIKISSSDLLAQSPYAVILIVLCFAVLLFLVVTAYATLIAGKKIVIGDNFINFSLRTLFLSWKTTRIDLTEVDKIIYKERSFPVVATHAFTVVPVLYIVFQYKDGKQEEIPVDNWGKKIIKQLLDEIRKRNKSITISISIEKNN